MKNINSLLLSILLFSFACQEAEIVSPNTYDCELTKPEIGNTHPNAADFKAALEKIIEYTPGVQVAVSSPNGHWTGAAGYADIPNNVALENCHRLMIASISKVVTATMVFQLQDEGLLNINDPLSKYLNSSLIGEIENADQVNLTHLLNHTSGIRDYLSTEQFINAVNTPNFKETQREKLKYVYGKKAYHNIGEQHTYSNTNTVLLGLVIEEVRQMRLWEVVDQYIAQPLGLERFVMGTENDPIPTGTARPYISFNGDKYIDILQHAVSDAATGDGGIATNTQDLNLFASALFSEELVSATALQQMTETLIDIPAEEADFPAWGEEKHGYGIYKYNTPWGIAFGHTGSTSSYSSRLFYFPENGAIYTIVYNGANWNGSAEPRQELRKSILDIITND